MDPETPETPQTNLWSTKKTDMTVGDAMKIGVGVAVVTAVAPYVIEGVVTGIKVVWHKRQGRKSEVVTEVPTETPEETPKKK